MLHSKKILSSLIAGAIVSTPALATNGYAPHGIGMKSKGMGGVSVAYQGDAVAAGGANPAGSAWMEDRFDVGVDLFRPIRNATITGMGDFDGSDTKLFAIPELGYRRGINDKVAFDLSVFGNGGMNTDYAGGIPLFSGAAPGGVETTSINLMQMFIVPSASYKVNENNSIGVGLNLVAQGFEAKGLGGFTSFSTSPNNLTDNGTDWVFGTGLRLGWMGKVSDKVTLGATYQTKTNMKEFKDYAGLFAGQGDFDIPANYGLGIAFQATPELTIAADYMYIRYGDIDSIGFPIDNFANCMGGDPSGCLGGDNGPGFGWENTSVVKLGVEYKYNPSLTLRAGYNHSDSPIPSTQTLFNVLAPATVEDHLTLGFTYQVNPTMEVTGAYMHAFKNEIKDTSGGPLGGAFPPAAIDMYQDSIGVSVSWKL